MFAWWKKRQRRKLLREPFPEPWEGILWRRVRQYRQVPAELHGRLRNIVQILAAERHFEGCGGLRLTDEVRITICGQAALLLLGVEDYFFDRVPSILVYPGSYVRPGGLGGELIVDEDQEYAGEAWAGGPIVLSWRDVLEAGKHGAGQHGAAGPGAAGHNVVLHEFAHHLDGLDGEMGGQPPLSSSELAARWTACVDREFEQLVQATRLGRPTLLDDYGATSKAEFFAVSTEAFFELSRELQHEYAEWYSLLAEFYRLDPASWA